MATWERSRVWSAGLLLLGAVATGCSSTDSGMVFQYANEGKICIFQAGNQTDRPGFPVLMSQSYAVGDVATVAVEFPTCFSSSCSKDIVTSCSVFGTGNALRVTSEGSYVEMDGLCTADCRVLVARCETPPLAGGTTTFQHGADMVSLTVPFAGAPPCAGPQVP